MKGFGSDFDTQTAKMVRFPNVVAKEGDGFNSDIGLFTARVDGIYSFTISALGYPSSSVTTHFDMVHTSSTKNDYVLCKAYGNGSYNNIGKFHLAQMKYPFIRISPNSSGQSHFLTSDFFGWEPRSDH